MSKYLDSEDIYEQWKIWRDSSEKLEDRMIPDKLAIMVYDLCKRLLGKSKYRGYDESLKEDLASNAMLKIFKNFKNMSEDKKDKFFNYLTLCAECSIKTDLKKYYRDLDTRNMMYDRAKAEAFVRCPKPVSTQHHDDL